MSPTTGLDEQETEHELPAISKPPSATPKPNRPPTSHRVTISTITSEDLKHASVLRRRLSFQPLEVSKLAGALPPSAEGEIADLCARVKMIYARVNMDYPAGQRMILDAVLLACTEIAFLQHRSIAIFPSMRFPLPQGSLAHGDADEVRLVNPLSGDEMYVSGGATVDYGVIEYDDVHDYKDRLLVPGGNREDVWDIAEGRVFFLMQAGHQRSLVSHIPGAVAHAIVLLKSANLPEVRFVLSNAHTWIFFILKSENGTLTYYESAVRQLSRDVLSLSSEIAGSGSGSGSDMGLREMVQLLCEWVRPIAAGTGLFRLE
ncbi:hypothetical protein B0H34DRAFT_670580 [Crassisporium funariophilum]|nr:hypothetical protein B0H34DRAFT_680180 [Crassisporium funariophilum]KAF8168408.1 hypothetical protein B0H34DRAFT_670580 [Crassisporium funariophilum]